MLVIMILPLNTGEIGVRDGRGTSTGEVRVRERYETHLLSCDVSENESEERIRDTRDPEERVIDHCGPLAKSVQ